RLPAPRTRAGLRADEILECLSGTREEIRQHRRGCSRYRTALGVALAPTIAANGGVCLLHGEILRDAEQSIGVGGLQRVQRTYGRRGPDRLRARDRLPRRTHEPSAEWNAATCCADPEPGWRGSPVGA